jgi:hypothetical protein
LLAFYSEATKCKRSNYKLRGKIDFIKVENPIKAIKDFKEGFLS